MFIENDDQLRTWIQQQLAVSLPSSVVEQLTNAGVPQHIADFVVDQAGQGAYIHTYITYPLSSVQIPDIAGEFDLDLDGTTTPSDTTDDALSAFLDPLSESVTTPTVQEDPFAWLNDLLQPLLSIFQDFDLGKLSLDFGNLGSQDPWSGGLWSDFGAGLDRTAQLLNPFTWLFKGGSST
jgi:hypothetical protein